MNENKIGVLTPEEVSFIIKAEYGQYSTNDAGYERALAKYGELKERKLIDPSKKIRTIYVKEGDSGEEIKLGETEYTVEEWTLLHIELLRKNMLSEERKTFKRYRIKDKEIVEAPYE